MVSAISSAIEKIAFLNSSKAIGSSILAMSFDLLSARLNQRRKVKFGRRCLLFQSGNQGIGQDPYRRPIAGQFRLYQAWPFSRPEPLCFAQLRIPNALMNCPARDVARVDIEAFSRPLELRQDFLGLFTCQFLGATPLHQLNIGQSIRFLWAEKRRQFFPQFSMHIRLTGNRHALRKHWCARKACQQDGN